jgi:hypothetical protein
MLRALVALVQSVVSPLQRNANTRPVIGAGDWRKRLRPERSATFNTPKQHLLSRKTAPSRTRIAACHQVSSLFRFWLVSERRGDDDGLSDDGCEGEALGFSDWTRPV